MVAAVNAKRIKPWKLPSPCCEAKRLYAAKYDAYYCSACFKWLEPQCNCTPSDHCPYSVDSVGVVPPTAEETR